MRVGRGRAPTTEAGDGNQERGSGLSRRLAEAKRGDSATRDGGLHPEEAVRLAVKA
jgi:hypothetical protein